MDKDPIVIKMSVPEAPGPVDKIPRFPWLKNLSGTRSTKITTALSAIVISITMICFVAFSLLANNNSFQKKHALDVLPKPPAQSASSSKNAAALPGGGIATGVGGTTGTNSPVITLTADPATVNIGGTATLKWSVTNNPKSCVASDDWSGNKSSIGTEKTPTLSKSQTYLFTLTCKTDTGTGFSTVSVGTISQTGGSGSVTARPTVTFAATPSSIYKGDSSTLSWSATNNPSSCSASGDWGGTKSATGAISTGQLNTVKQYSYSLKCVNSSGESPIYTVTVAVSDPPAGLPIVALSANPIGPILPGSSTILSWNTTNNPSSCNASGDWSGTKSASGTFNTGTLNTIKTYTYTITCTGAGGSTFDSAAIAVLPNPPSISLTINPTSILVGNSATISWGVTNSTSGTTCTASGDWPGSLNITPVSGGTRNTGTLNTAKTYLYSLSCTNEGGTSKVNNVPLTVSLPPPPVITISVSPISISTGQSATISWTASNNPTSCTPSNDLTAPITPLASGNKSTGTLNTARTYTYTLQCSNAGGSSNIAQTTLNVGSGSSSSPPVVTISASPSSISTGSASTISWSATNNPTSCSAGGTTSNWVSSPGASGSTSTGTISSAGTRTYSITCSNSAGSGSGSTTLTVVAMPTVSVSLGASTINTGSSTTYSWSSSGASSCSGGGQLSGSKATSGGPISTGTMSTAGTYSYTISCVNSIGGSASATATLNVTNPAPVYCAGLSPCYGPTNLAGHASPGNCWGWNLTWVINMTSFRPNHPGGTQTGSLESASGTCNHDIHAILSGTQGITGYKAGGGQTTFNHTSGTKNNTGTALSSYRVGYYDASKP